jgi:hypothetical protein
MPTVCATASVGILLLDGSRDYKGTHTSLATHAAGVRGFSVGLGLGLGLGFGVVSFALNHKPTFGNTGSFPL